MHITQEQMLRALLAVAVIFVLLYGYNTTFNKTPRAVSTVGYGTKKVTADKAVVSFAVVMNFADKTTALENGDAKLSDLLVKLDQFQPTEVSKTAPQVTPQAGGRGYQYVATVQVTVPTLDRVAPLMQMLTQEDATVTPVKYLSANQETVDNEVRTLAIQDARKKAQQMASSAGAHVGKVLSISEPANSNTNGRTVSSGQNEIEVQSTLTVVYEIW